ncbi:hypothetical protein [Curtobacterium sp. MCBD17_032]|uniref:hypothetical protein n=1 Tax=Curtobacterium sp. MCBD17_032 TaxID=2175659 RepID=UPI000DA86A66|nr:hypothetical protein [Curtobacterium sp. MCBD17_032]PZE80867.1 hypothetical protein DEI91_13610 [Curtobacterium sp. MCBD17_032]
MDSTTAKRPASSPRYSHEIAAAVTLPAAARALVDTAALTTADAIAVATGCGALATRIGLLRFLADPDRVASGTVAPVDPFCDGMPAALVGRGPSPDRDRLRHAGDRCVESWRIMTRTADGVRATHGVPPVVAVAGVSGAVGVAGALALGAWCSWALGSELRAATRARYALDLRADDPLAMLVDRLCRIRRRPAWRT